MLRGDELCIFCFYFLFGLGFFFFFFLSSFFSFVFSIIFVYCVKKKTIRHGDQHEPTTYKRFVGLFWLCDAVWKLKLKLLPYVSLLDLVVVLLVLPLVLPTTFTFTLSVVTKLKLKKVYV